MAKYLFKDGPPDWTNPNVLNHAIRIRWNSNTDDLHFLTPREIEIEDNQDKIKEILKVNNDEKKE